MKFRLLTGSSLLALSLVLSSCVLPGTITSTTSSPSATPSQTQSAPAPTIQPGSVAAIEAALEAVYAQVNPSVVNIQVLLSSLGSSTLPPNHPSVTPTPTPDGPPLGSALGSGFVWDTAGYIVTNNHVVDGASKITVTFYDGTTVKATLVGTDPDSDLAVIKVDMPAAQLHPVKLADSDRLKVGQIAIAIGNPFGLEGTMTVGFISGLGRVLPANSAAIGPSYSIPDVIQTDASINPGNSGGVLLDSSGALIGITFAIDTNSGTSAGVGFAIPSAIVEQVAPSLITSGRYDHPWLGVSIVSLGPDLASAMGLPAGQRGALVMTVTAGSPAEKAGLQASSKQVTIDGLQATVGGDVIIAFNGQTVKTSDDLISALAREGVVGQKANLTVLRGGKEILVTVTLGARPAS